MNYEIVKVIIKYSCSDCEIDKIVNDVEGNMEIIDSNYAIIALGRENIPKLKKNINVEKIELSKKLGLCNDSILKDICAYNEETKERDTKGLYGEGVIMAFLDSGIDYRHSDFCNEDGTTRILYIWDQGIKEEGFKPPQGFAQGSEYTKKDIDNALFSERGNEFVKTKDEIGHGTLVAGIAAGNGRAGKGKYIGVAPKSNIIVVKLGDSTGGPPESAELMSAIKYVTEKAKILDMPISINISYGTNNAAHDGKSLIEEYIDDMILRWKTVVVVATGNEGNSGHHYKGNVKTGEVHEVDFNIAENVDFLYLSMWKNFVDTVNVEIIAPDGTRSGIVDDINNVKIFEINTTQISILFEEPSTYCMDQEINIRIKSIEEIFEGEEENLKSVLKGNWKLLVTGIDIVNGDFDIWLPITEKVTKETKFLNPSRETTLTIPSSGKLSIAVGGYNQNTKSYAIFSGMGYTRGGVMNAQYVKPDIVAPCVNIMTTSKGGFYDTFTGTSGAAPFVSGTAALLMQWGIVLGNDEEMYAEKVKAYLLKGATRYKEENYPNKRDGYGALCIGKTIEYLENKKRT